MGYALQLGLPASMIHVLAPMSNPIVATLPTGKWSNPAEVLPGWAVLPKHCCCPDCCVQAAGRAVESVPAQLAGMPVVPTHLLQHARRLASTQRAKWKTVFLQHAQYLDSLEQAHM